MYSIFKIKEVKTLKITFTILILILKERCYFYRLVDTLCACKYKDLCFGTTSTETKLWWRFFGRHDWSMTQ